MILVISLVIIVVVAIVLLMPTRWIVGWLQEDGVRYFAITTQRCVALTFDDGPDPVKTPQILRVLAEHNVKATFFVTGERVHQYPELAQRIVDEGHLLGNHHWRDERTISLPVEDIVYGLCDTHDLIAKHQPQTSFFRPGVGFYNKTVKFAMTARNNYTIVLGDVYPHDVVTGHWPRLIAFYILWHVRPGSIVILHDKECLPTEKTLSLVIPALKRRGFAFSTLIKLFPK